MGELIGEDGGRMVGGCVCTGLGWDRGEMDVIGMDEKGMGMVEMTGGCVC